MERTQLGRRIITNNVGGLLTISSGQKQELVLFCPGTAFYWTVRNLDVPLGCKLFNDSFLRFHKSPVTFNYY